MELGKLLSMTFVLTVLIWASADSLVNETVSARVSFEVEPLADPNMLIELDPDAKARWFEVQISGPRKIIEKVQAEEPLTLRLRVPDHPTGPASIRLGREMLKRAMLELRPEFGKLTIVSVQPSKLLVMVDHMVTHELTVTTRRLTLAYDDEPQPKPMFTTVRLRESVYSNLPRAQQRSQIDIAAEVERLLRGKPAGQPVTLLVPLDGRAYGPDAELHPDRIEVTATVKADRTTREIPTVPIKLVVSFANLARPHRAVARDGATLTLETQTIKVTGPTEAVSRLLRGETRAYGFIQLKEADLEELGVFKAWTPDFHLPPEIELAEPSKPIEFKLIGDTSTEHS